MKYLISLQVLSYLIFSITNLARYIYSTEKVLWGGCLLSIIGGCITAWIFNTSMLYLCNKHRKHLLDGDYEKAKQKYVMNHFNGIFANGGIGYLLQDKLVFVPHKYNFSKKTITISFVDIAKISRYKVYGIVNSGLKITLKSGKEEKFIVDKSFFIDKLNDIFVIET